MDYTTQQHTENVTSVNNTYITLNTTAAEIRELTLEDVLYMHIEPLFIVCRYVHLLWYFVGFFGNITSAVIWNTPHMYNVCSSAHYLVTISICDVLCQLFHITYYLKHFWRIESLGEENVCDFWSILYMIPLYISELLLLGLTIEKLISIRNPFRSGWFSRHQRAPKEIVWIVTCVTVLSLLQAYIWQVDSRDYCDDIRENRMEFRIWNWLCDVFIYIITPVTVVVIVFKILREAKHSIIGVSHRHQGRVNVTRTLRQSTIVIIRLSLFRVCVTIPATCVHFLLHVKYFSPSSLPHVFSSSDVNDSETWQRFIKLYTAKYTLELLSSAKYALGVFVFALSCRHFKRDFKARVQNLARTTYISLCKIMTYIREKINSYREDEFNAPN
ncbi:uncharacterized protein LOC127880273 [Dreissena polymorpha]|uniref:G-protein coupled receptors family 1 profile domain-containing protein n=1 Tax=Dreissena polymorpha TaxID=45954 RepID=A0A9D4K3X7_DREPO|nr:uncharacterized protein LOC127880273 [Dreissena polymorpha]KAH3832563.1 hypothetical protein DPMN_105854 [Dreissena polymorpha]